MRERALMQMMTDRGSRSERPVDTEVRVLLIEMFPAKSQPVTEVSTGRAQAFLMSSMTLVRCGR